MAWPCSSLILVLPFCEVATRAGCQVSTPSVSRQRTSTRVPGSGVRSGTISILGGRVVVAVGVEALEGGDFGGPGSGDDFVSRLDGDEGSVKGFRGVGRGASASGEEGSDGGVGVVDGIGLLKVVG